MISGDVGLRKPNKEIYELLLRQIGASPEDVIFVDDSPANVVAAMETGIHGILFDPDDSNLSDQIPAVVSFDQLC